MKSIEESVRLIAGHVFGMTVPFLVSISGPTCSGKTTLATELGIDPFLQCYDNAYLSLDDYMRDYDDPRLPKEAGRLIFDHPQSYKSIEYIADIKQLVSSQNAQVPIYVVKDNRRSMARRLIKAPQLLISEGLFSILFLRYSSEVRKFNIYLDVPVEVCLARRIKRDVELYGVTPEQVTSSFWSTVWPNYSKFAEIQKSDADLIIAQ